VPWQTQDRDALWDGRCHDRARGEFYFVVLVIQQESTMASPAFKRFKFSFFEYKDSARDGLDIAALEALEGEERAEAEELLFNFLPDMRGAIGLGVLRSKRAEAPLTKMLQEEEASESKFAVPMVAMALWQIRPDKRWLDSVLEVLTSSETELERMEAAMALKKIHDPAAVSPLMRALDDTDALVRHHAAGALLAIHGLPSFSQDWTPQHMVFRIMRDDAAMHAAAKQEIFAAIAGRPISAD